MLPCLLQATPKFQLSWAIGVTVLSAVTCHLFDAYTF